MTTYFTPIVNQTGELGRPGHYDARPGSIYPIQNPSHPLPAVGHVFEAPDRHWPDVPEHKDKIRAGVLHARPSRMGQHFLA